MRWTSMRGNCLKRQSRLTRRVVVPQAVVIYLGQLVKLTFVQVFSKIIKVPAKKVGFCQE